MKTVKDGVHYDKTSRWISIGKKIQKEELEEFERALNTLLLDSKEKPIIVFLSGEEGGGIFPCLTLLRLIENSPAPLFTVAVGTLFSGFLHVLQGGKKRFATADSELLLHRVTETFRDEHMNASDLYDLSEYLLMLDMAQVFIFCKRGAPYRDIVELLREEEDLSPKEALELKLIDAIV